MPLLPLARTGPPSRDALPLAGSACVWFDEVRVPAPSKMPQAVNETPHAANATQPVAALDAGTRARLSAARAPISGLSFERPLVMGILNVTPDSFSDGGDGFRVQEAVEAAARMVAAGADIVDIGGESTRPGAEAVPEKEEIRRVLPVIEAIQSAGIVTVVSVDTRKSAVAAAALDAGAQWVNDVSALTYDAAMVGLLAERGCPAVLMHAQGDPQTMQVAPSYVDVVSEVVEFLRTTLDRAVQAGAARDALIIDPGIGFGKTLDHNMALLQALPAFHDLGAPLLLGASRKRFIGTLGGADAPKARMPGSLAVALHGAALGAHILRVHDVAETRQALALWAALNDKRGL